MVLGVITFATMTQIGCPPLQFYGRRSNDSEKITFNNLACNAGCGCSSTKYEPICSADGQTVLFSPCQAGCKDVKDVEWTDGKKNKTIKQYLDCACVETSAKETKNKIANPWPENWPDLNSLPPPTNPDATPDLDYAFAGYCPSSCVRQFYLLLGLMLTIGLIAATSRLPNTLVLLRAIEQRDKAAALTVTVSFVSAFALLPSPIIFGSIYDRACTIWAEICGQQLNCLAYNTDKLRIGVGTLSAVFMALGLCCDIGVWYYVKGLRIWDCDDDNDSEKVDDDVVTTVTNDSSRRNTLEMNQNGYSDKI